MGLMNVPPGKLVGTWEPRPRPKTKAELAAMSHEDRLMYQIFGPRPSEREREASLEREMRGLSELEWADQQEGPISDEDYMR